MFFIQQIEREREMDFSTRNTSFISTFKWANSEVVFKKKENDKGKDGEKNEIKVTVTVIGFNGNTHDLNFNYAVTRRVTDEQQLHQ